MKNLKSNKRNYFKLLLILIMFIPFGILNLNQTEIPKILPENVSYFQDSRCEFNVFQIINSIDENIRVDLNIENFSPIECFGKNSWSTYEQAKQSIDDNEKIIPEFINIWIFTNFHVDLILQSLFWLIMISFIPKHNIVNFKYPKLSSIALTALFYLHLVGEQNYYSSISRNFDLSLISREFSGEMYFGNFYLYNYLLIFSVILYFLINLLRTRINNIINYLPYIFLVYGTYSSLNINFYYIFFTFLGINYLLQKKINTKFIGVYLIFNIFWIGNFNPKDIFFDVDKVKGLINTSQTYPSLFFWSISFFLFISGVIYFLKENFTFLNLSEIRKHFLISASLVIFFGVLSATNYLFNFFSYYFLGLNKFGMYSLESKTGNTWRGIAPSAEGMGEFFGFVILFCFITWKSFDVKIEKYQFVLILIVGFGLYRTNNFAAFSSLILLIIMYYVLSKSKNKRNTIIVFICLIILILSFLIYFFNIFTYEDLSSRIIYNALQVSIFDNGATQELNEVNLNQIEIGNFEYVLNLRDDQKNLSSSLEYLLNRRVYGSNIDNVPNVFSIISFASFFINRSEKWGIFVAKYNPQNLEELLLVMVLLNLAAITWSMTHW